MKIIALLLSFIVLMLTLMPCCAVEEPEHHIHETVQQKTQECNEQGDDCCKDCSPFYVCGTCIGFTLNKQQLFSLVILFRQMEHSTAYIPGELSPISPTIWQPPKLS